MSEPVNALLEIRSVSKSYGATPVLEGVTFSMARGELLGIIGPNGSGKTTLFGTISGGLPIDAGSVRLDGVDVSTLKASRRAQMGIGRTFQVPQAFADMSVYENLLVAARFGAQLGGKAADELVADIMDLTNFSARADALAGKLPLLDRKRLELARALATRPSLLLLDEIAGGLTDDEAQELAATVTGLVGPDLGIIWIEHLVHILTGAVDRLLVLGNGVVVADGSPKATMESPEVRKIYLGLEPDSDDLDH
ncbi:ATP-binding cassette domain-containing protein [Devosia sp. FKR38]|uniref:ABC transporter ATP-binding protein n=1 Tax=Devosia sp. FKR38 TaxID=2562312 RepID=UPI0010C1515E|nr:ATP-binding cassette domain-containing protein [Devosia sp. FKR38]